MHSGNWVTPNELCNVRLRETNVYDDDHPVELVLAMKEFEPVQTWLEGMDPSFPRPETQRVPVTWTEKICESFMLNLGEHLRDCDTDPPLLPIPATA